MKRWFSVFLLMLVFLAACGGNEGTAGSEGEQTESDEPAAEQEKESTEKADNAETEEDKEEESNKGSEEDKAAQEAFIQKESQYEMTDSWSFQPIADADPEVALLTIDDIPDEHALEMAETLKEKEAPAIFFVNGHFLDTPDEELADKRKQWIKEIHEMGFPIGNHTYSHKDLKTMSEEEQREEILTVSDQIEDITGERPVFYRSPFGSNTDFVKQLAEEEGMLLMNWTYGYDWEQEYQNASSLADIMVNTPLLADGANLLMHDRDWTNEALGDIVDGLRDKGYTLLDPALIQTP
ncbi:polysaccharide deacetylase family protein [Halobacillus litoralis]|uniref:Polysaccharide deacetylase family protein n=1 Tax=Halobacillus litoralis TaxID=45668 RepID=A0A845DQ73_9BACI|nr:polysaccharide deacetylase family protein [Halobacillus litoralis]MYL19039.1 polysaccharide deacetylase family protein [Halobacillus litoralis]